MDSRGPRRFTLERPQVLRGRSDGAAVRQGFVKAVQTTVFPARRDLQGDLSDAAV